MPKGTKVSVFGEPRHMDPDYHEDPEEFRPERFAPENRGDIKTSAYMTFGFGPRACIGKNLATLEAKVLMYHLLRKYKIELCKEKMKLPMKIDGERFNRIVGGCYLNFIERS